MRLDIKLNLRLVIMGCSVYCNYSNKLINKLKSLDVKNILDYDLIEQAIYWAKKYHHGQFRKTGEPFYTHPIEVAYIVSDYNLKTDVIVASILHDIVEDTDATSGMILDSFGPRIEEMVDRLTRDRPDGSKLKVEQILNNAYAKNDKEVLLIKLVDRVHNMQTIKAQPYTKIQKIVNDTLNHFIITAIHTEYRDLEKLIYQLCCQNLLGTSAPSYHYIKATEDYSYLRNTDIHPLVSQAFQNARLQSKNIMKLVDLVPDIKANI
ncbi:MAG: HD domain-containing protein [Rickettsiaceae bacterium]|nr:HD domain-containing protein [Rickettsiaceae bacterium]